MHLNISIFYWSFYRSLSKLFNCFLNSFLFILGEKCDCPSAIFWYYRGSFFIIENNLLYNREQGKYMEPRYQYPCIAHFKRGTVLEYPHIVYSTLRTVSRVHFNFRAGSTLLVPVSTVPSSMDRTSWCNKVDAVRLYGFI